MAEDAFQATFLQIHLKCEQFEQGRSFRPWMYTIATNQAIDAQRRNRRHRMVSLDQTSGDGEDLGKLVDLLISGDVDPLDSVDGMERRQQVQDALDALPEHLRSVLHLVYYQGLKYREAADVLGVPVGTIKSRVHTAILKLTDAWKQAHADQD
jgi:RNA polymerase sigma-70 factor (ECF subfamily)